MYRIYFLLMTVIICWSCQKDDSIDDGIDKGLEKHVLGKWELVRDSTIINWLTEETGINEYIPGGYVEFLPEGQLAWYDYQTTVYTLFKGKYVVANWIWFPTVPTDNLYLRFANRYDYDSQREEIGNPFGLPDCWDNPISFDGENTMILYHSVRKGRWSIYERIK